MTFDVELYFNGRLTGAGQKLVTTVDADSVHEALDMAIAAALRDRRHGQSIYATGCLVRERKR